MTNKIVKYSLIGSWYNEFLNSCKQKVIAHNVRVSPWPIMVSFSVFSLLFNTACFFNSKFNFASIFIILSLICLIASMYFWFNDVLWESTIEKQHTWLVSNAIRYGFFLFIISEVMFFVSFFWGFFHFSLSPSVYIFSIWPPIGIQVVDPFSIPFLNTVILLSSGVYLTFAHHDLLKRNQESAFLHMQITIALGLLFILLQLFEYTSSPFSMNDSVYGSIFFMATGFHGLHVIVGTIFLIVTCYRLSTPKNATNSLRNFIKKKSKHLSKNQYVVRTKKHNKIINTIEAYKPIFNTKQIKTETIKIKLTFGKNTNTITSKFPLTAESHFGFEAAAYYWHFVDVVWLFLFVSIYCWSFPTQNIITQTIENI